MPVDVKSLEVDFLTIAGHKLYAPKGIGALYIRNGINIEPLIHGAGHEVLNSLNETAASTGSACHSGLTTISPVLKAMGVSDEVGRGAVRFSLGRYTTKNEIETIIHTTL